MYKIGLCFMNIGESYKQITFWSRQNKINYCNLHGYDFIEDESTLIKDKPIPWTKIPLLLKYIDKYDYIVWVDADILIMNSSIKIEHFIQKYPFDIVCGSDWKMINTGVMIIKSNDFTKNFISHIIVNEFDPNEDPNGRYLNWEQGSFINLYDKNYMDAKNHIFITEPTIMNSYWFNYFPGHFVFHFAGVRGNLLQYLIRDFYPDRFDHEDDDAYKGRMDWLAGPVRDHLDKKLKHEKLLDTVYYFSLTTIPSRINNINDTITSLINQTVKPTKIFINIPSFYKRFNTSYNELKLPTFPETVEIVISDQDYGPASKFIPTFLNNNIDSNTPIIIVDDDMIYDPETSLNLLKESINHPDSCITSFGITHSAYIFDNSQWFCEFNSQYKKPCGFRTKEDGFIDVFEAFKGTLLKKKFFKENITHFPSFEFCLSDDVWFSGHIINNGFSIFLKNFNSTTHLNPSQSSTDDLSFDIDIRNKRMKDTAEYLHNTFNIWRKLP